MTFTSSPHTLRRLPFQLFACATLVLSLACGRSDSAIETDTRERLGADPVTQNMNLTVTASDRVVRLSGVTESRTAQERAVEVARTVEGVTDVVNEIELRESPLAQAVRAALQSDPLVADIPIDVEVEDTLIRLKSDQTNQEQRTRAVQLARQVEGVEAVEDWMK